MAAMYRAAGGDDRTAIELTNRMLEGGTAVEVNFLRDRLVLVHRRLVPALYRARRRERSPDDLSGLSPQSLRVHAFIAEHGTATAGDMRRLFGISGHPNPDPAYVALSALQHEFLIDRGPADVPKTGIPYLSKEGYPYRLFHRAHADLVAKASKLNIDRAAEELILGYLQGAVFGSRRFLMSHFKNCLGEQEVEVAIKRLATRRKVTLEKVGRQELVIASLP